MFANKGDVAKSIYAIKYKNKREYIDFFTDEIVKWHGKEIEDFNCDAITYVPVHFFRKMKRGYNQAELIARELSRKTGIPVRRDLLIRRKNTVPLKKLMILKEIKCLRMLLGREKQLAIQ